MMRPILPPAWLGVLGGGQLGRFFVIAAREMGYRVAVLDPDPRSPAGALAHRHIAADYEAPAALEELASLCAAVTTEFENVPAASLAWLAGRTRVAPSSECVAIAQDRIREKSSLAQHGFPVGPWRAVRSHGDFEEAADLLPGILKTARLGYDGKGQATVETGEQALDAWRRFGGVPCVLEKRLPLDKEISAIVGRGDSGETRCFAVSENRHRDGILDISIVPARAAADLADQAQSIASRLAAAIGYVGVLAVEFFIVDGKLLVNEIAPRPHNSGHYTIEACATSQYEQQVRALCALPLGDPRLLTPATMVNLLGDVWHRGEPAWDALLGDSRVKLQLYGKESARPGRKMGHFTVLDADRDVALAVALALREKLGIGAA